MLQFMGLQKVGCDLVTGQKHYICKDSLKQIKVQLLLSIVQILLFFFFNHVGKVLSLLLNMLSRLVITFLPRSKRLLISWLQSPSAVILEPPKIKSAIVSTVSPSITHEVMGPDAMILVF